MTGESTLRLTPDLEIPEEWPRFPVRGKTPLTPHGFKDASSRRTQIVAWANEHPGCGWAVPTGAASALVVDIDGGQGEESWLAVLEERGFPNIETPEARTGGGGRHLYFRHSEGVRSRVAILPGIDVRAEGGYVVVPPSPHESGRPYSWKVSPRDAPLSDPPLWLIELCKNGHAPDTSGPQLPGKVREGQRNAALTSLAGSMRRRGAGKEAIRVALLAENAARCEPPLPNNEVERIAASVARYAPEAAGPMPAAPKSPKTTDFLAALSALGWSFRLNEADDSIEVNGAPMGNAIRALIRCQLRDAGFTPLEAAEDAWTAEAGLNAYHPVREFLLNLKWDRQDHIGRLLEHFQDEHAVFSTYLRRWLVGAVARAVKGGVQNRVLVLDGAQGLGKSHFVRWLASPLPFFFCEAPILPDDKDSALRLIGSWLWEIAELGATVRRADREALKFFLSQETVTVRRPYGRNDIRKPALASFAATVNGEGGFLADPTGSRRFMATTLRRIEWAYADTLSPESVWAQAVALYKRGEPWNLSPAEAKRAAELNEGYAVGDPVEDAVERRFELAPGDAEAFVPTSEIVRALSMDVTGLGTDALTRRVGAVLAKAGLRQERRRTDRGQVRGWVGIRARLGAG